MRAGKVTPNQVKPVLEMDTFSIRISGSVFFQSYFFIKKMNRYKKNKKHNP